ncbi:hypothetical protein LALCDEHK_00074 [bovine alphaherpesvirus 1]|nr:hypothetical protein GOGNHFCO_00061 [Bovine alphaherpesvirus 1]AVM39299.1 hypothetical protein GOGNHFCO_00076 [Bovine alphaherpesvirus 1]AVM39939.1 hypothetical protein BLEONNCJ_00061 [Bovine alphaherpesvirus 1]AVM39952.1 hypothetical protein BLEONNCJ_00074 [Bovine alphaherpesvirus 1]AVM40084.1 hypothetical protein LALCDEHK_00061 [Bovine alphaherpesvirus 1]
MRPVVQLAIDLTDIDRLVSGHQIKSIRLICKRDRCIGPFGPPDPNRLAD